MSTSSEESLFTFFVSSCTSIAQWMYALHIFLQCMGWLPSSNLMCVFTFIQWMYALASSEQSSCIIQWRAGKSNPWAAMSVQSNKAAFFLKKNRCRLSSSLSPAGSHKLIIQVPEWSVEMLHRCISPAWATWYEPSFYKTHGFVWRVSKMYPFSKPWHENINMGEQWTSNLGTV